jgi:hypothetical protein
MYHEPVIRHDRSIQQIWLLCLCRSERGRTLLMKMEREVLHQWEPMVGTLSTHEKGCGQYSRGGIFYSYVKHMGGSHIMYVDSWSCRCAGYVKSSH